MNIFLTSPDPVACAQALDDRRVIKMALETAQLLSVAVRLRCNHDGSNIYGLTHYNHPCARWCRRTVGNFLWLVDHGIALCDEYTFRYSRHHKSRSVVERCRDFAYSTRFGLLEAEPVAFDFNSSADKDIADVFLAYRTTMMRKWTVLDLQPDKRGRVHAPRWSYRRRPSWYDLALLK